MQCDDCNLITYPSCIAPRCLSRTIKKNGGNFIHTEEGPFCSVRCAKANGYSDAKLCTIQDAKELCETQNHYCKFCEGLTCASSCDTCSETAVSCGGTMVAHGHGGILCIECEMKNHNQWKTFVSVCNCFAAGYCSREEYIKAWASTRLTISVQYWDWNIQTKSDPRISVLKDRRVYRNMSKGVLDIIGSYLQMLSLEPKHCLDVCSSSTKDYKSKEYKSHVRTRGQVMSLPLFDIGGVSWCLVKKRGDRDNESVIVERNNGRDLTIGDIWGLFHRVPVEAEWVKYSGQLCPWITI